MTEHISVGVGDVGRPKGLHQGALLTPRKPCANDVNVVIH